jgi:hypothetical protein
LGNSCEAIFLPRLFKVHGKWIESLEKNSADGNNFKIFRVPVSQAAAAATKTFEARMYTPTLRLPSKLALKLMCVLN